MALVQKGIKHCKSQLESACKIFGNCPESTPAETELANPDYAGEMPESEDGSDFCDDEIFEAEAFSTLSDVSTLDSEDEYSD